MTDPTSRQRGRHTEIRQQLSENNLRTESNIWSQVPEWARYLDILTDWPSVATWLRLRSFASSGVEPATFYNTNDAREYLSDVDSPCFGGNFSDSLAWRIIEPRNCRGSVQNLDPFQPSVIHCYWFPKLNYPADVFPLAAFAPNWLRACGITAYETRSNTGVVVFNPTTRKDVCVCR
jgi:hypothetical protein